MERGHKSAVPVKLNLVSIRDLENHLLAERMAQNEASYQTSILTAVLGGVFAFILVLAILFKIEQ
jgi:hypothetical protein